MSKIGQLSAIKHLRIAAQGPLYDNDNAHDLCARALLELADRLEALEARMDGPTPTTQHTYSLRPPLGDWQHQAIAQGPKQRSDP